jgi:hypothetical protein
MKTPGLDGKILEIHIFLETENIITSHSFMKKSKDKHLKHLIYSPECLL